MDLGEPPLDPTELTTETLTMDKPAVPEVKEEYNDESEHFEHRGGGSLTATSGDPTLGSGGGLNIKAWGPGAKVSGLPGGVQGKGFGGSGLGGRGSGHRAAHNRHRRRNQARGSRRRAGPELALPSSRQVQRRLELQQLQ